MTFSNNYASRQYNLVTKYLQVFFLFSVLRTTQAQDDDIEMTQLFENEYYGNVNLEDKSMDYYMFTVDEETTSFNKTQQIAFKAYAVSPKSDPDIFISKQQEDGAILFPSSNQNAEYYCEQVGSDYCFVKPDDIEIGDTFFVGVYCHIDCQYGLKVDIVENWITLEDGERESFIFSDYSTSVINYNIPYSGEGGSTEYVEVIVEAPDNESPIQLFFSTSEYQQIPQMKESEFITDDGMAIKFTEQDQDWCSDCDTYITLIVQEQGRYYITAKAYGDEQEVYNTIKQEVFVEAFQQECVNFGADSVQNDLQFDIWFYRGHAAAYVAVKFAPDDVNDWENTKFPVFYGLQSSIIISAEDKSRQDLSSSQYYLCFWGYADSSVQIVATEGKFVDYYTAHEDVQYQLTIEGNSQVYFNITDDEFEKGDTTVYIESIVADSDSNQSPPQMYYWACNAKECETQDFEDAFEITSEASQACLDDEDCQFLDPSNNTYVQFLSGSISGQTFTGSFEHQMDNCDFDQCLYIIKMINTDGSYLNCTFKFTTDVQYHEVVEFYELNEPRVAVNMSRYVYYKVESDMYSYYDDLDSLVINVESYSGDADLFVSLTEEFPTTSSYDYQSRSVMKFDQIILNRTDYFSLNQDIYIAVYGQTMAYYSILVYPVIGSSFQSALQDFQELQDNEVLYDVFENEFQEMQLKYIPNWSSAEDRTLVFYCQELYNQVRFYVEWDSYPSTATSQSSNDAQVVTVNDYSPSQNHYGAYYLRVMPDYTVASLISTSEYAYNFYSFSVKPWSYFEDLQLSEMIYGYANRSSNYYRHMMIDLGQDKEYTITVNPHQGDPDLYIMVSSSDRQPSSTMFDYQSEESGVKQEKLTITYNDRILQDGLCQSSKMSLQSIGDYFCALFIGVACVDTECVYEIEVTMNDVIANDYSETNEILPPSYVYVDEWYTGDLEDQNDIRYFYMPVNPQQDGGALVIVNKTHNVSLNGKIGVYANIQSYTDQSDYLYTDWKYPTESKNDYESFTNTVDQPEVIYISKDDLNDECGNDDCSIVFGIENTNTDPTKFRIKGLKGDTMLQDSKPVQGTINVPGEYEYYWFVSLEAKENDGAYWQHSIALQIDSLGGDADLYVSVMDGRDPTSEDYDFKSENAGADTIIVRQNDTLFDLKGWDDTAGVVVVVAVKAKTQYVDYTLVQFGPAPLFFPITVVSTSQYQPINLPYSGQRSESNPYWEYFMWYNYGFLSWQFITTAQDGEFTVYLSKYETQNPQIDNGLLSIPIDGTNTFYSKSLSEGDSESYSVYRFDLGDYTPLDNLLEQSFNVGQMCYDCWILCAIKATNPTKTDIYIEFENIYDNGNNFQDIVVGGSAYFAMPTTDSSVQLKFVLNSKADIKFDFVLEYGSIDVKISMNPYSFEDDDVLWSSSGADHQLTINQDDPNLFISTYYYMLITSNLNQAELTVYLEQYQNVDLLMTNERYKFQFTDHYQQEMHFAFLANPGDFTFSVQIEQITEGFYPQVFLHKNTINPQQIDNVINQLYLPNIYIHDFSFGENFLAMLNSDTFSYSISDTGSDDLLTYYSITIEKNTWGMATELKPEFLLTIFYSDQSDNSNDLSQGSLNDDQSISQEVTVVNSPTDTETETVPDWSQFFSWDKFFSYVDTDGGN